MGLGWGASTNQGGRKGGKNCDDFCGQIIRAKSFLDQFQEKKLVQDFIFAPQQMLQRKRVCVCAHIYYLLSHSRGPVGVRTGSSLGLGT